MTYVGAVPTTGDFKLLDSITTSSATTFNLRQGGVAVYPQSNSHCLVVLNGILQTGGSSFNIVNDTIVFAEALTSSDVINQILVLGNVNDIGVPSDDTVSSSKIQSSAVTDAKISAMASSKLTGVVPTANLGSGTASSSTVLYGDQTFKTAPSGGLTLVDSGTGSSVTQVNFDSVFTTSYKAYKFVGGFRPANNGEDLWFILRSGGSNAGNSSYRYVVKGFIAETSGDSEARQNAWGNPYWKVSTNGASNNSSNMQYVDMNLYNPMAASTTFGADNAFISGNSSLYSGGAQVVYSNFACMFNSSGNYDGLHMTYSSGNISSYNYQVYGFNPS